MRSYCTREALLVIFLIPAIIFVSFYTNSIFHLFYEGFAYIEVNSLTVPVVTPGIMFRVLNIANILSQIFCFLILFKVTLQSPRLFRRQMVLLVVCIFLAFISMGFYFLISRPFPNFDPVPIFLMIIGVIVLIAIFRFQFFDLIHIPYHSIFDNLEEGIIVLDAQSRIIQINKKVAELLEIIPELCIGESLSSLETCLKPCYDMLVRDEYTSINIRTESDKNGENLSLVD